MLSATGCDSPTPAVGFNTSAFAAPAPFTFGNAGAQINSARGWRAILRYVRVPQIAINERFWAQLRVEAYNVFNTVKLQRAHVESPA